jgi:streptogramin lyase
MVRGMRLALFVLAACLSVTAPSSAVPLPPAPPPAGPAPTVAAPLATAAPVGTITTVGHPGISTPGAIVTAANGDLWFLDGRGIGRITTAGVVTMFRDPAIVYPRGIAAGSDGNIWFTNERAVGRLTPAGVVTTFDTDPYALGTIVAGADGALHVVAVVEETIGYVLRVSTDGVITNPDRQDMGGLNMLVAGADGSFWRTGGYATISRYIDGVDHEVLSGERAQPRGMVVAADGTLWFTNNFNEIGHTTPAGAVTYYTDPGIQGPAGITVGPDAALWFTNGAGSIGKVTTAGAVTIFRDPSIQGGYQIATGPDGALWFGNPASSSIGRITTAGAVTSFTADGIGAPGGITSGPDGNLWFTNGPSSIGRSTPDGAVTTFHDPSIHAPRALVTGGDGALWFLNAASPTTTLGRITTAGAVASFPGPAAARTDAIAAAPDGSIWFFADQHLWRATTAGAVSEVKDFTDHTDPSSESAVTSMVFTPDGDLWYVQTYTRAYGGGYPITTRRIGRRTAAGAFEFVVNGGTQSLTVGPDGSIWYVEDATRIGHITGPNAGTLHAVPAGTLSHVAAGADGSLWFTTTVGTSGGYIGRMSSDGQVTRFDAATVMTPLGITPGADGAMWFANAAGGTIGRITTTTSSAFHAVAPTRLLDSRTAMGGWSAKLAPPLRRSLKVTGGVVPASASAVVLNVTATNATAGSFLQAWPGGETRPMGSNLNFAAGQTIPNLVTVQVGTGGEVWFANNIGAVDVIADVVGYYDDETAEGDLYNAITPARALDSRTGTGGWSGPLTAGTARDLKVASAGSAGAVPPTATAVVANVTVTDSSAGSFLTAWKAGDPAPATSNLNFGPGQTIANLAIIPLSASGSVRLATAVGTTHVIVDVVGYFDPTAGLRFHATSPLRVLDDRIGIGALGPWPPSTNRAVPTASAATVLAGARAQVLNITVTNATAGSFLTVAPGDAPTPTTSTINFAPNETIANLTTTGVDGNGRIAIRNHLGRVDVIADALGYYAPT